MQKVLQFLHIKRLVLLSLLFLLALGSWACVYKRKALRDYRQGEAELRDNNYRDAYRSFMEAYNRVEYKEWEYKSWLLYKMAHITLAAQELRETDRHIFESIRYLGRQDTALVDSLLNLHSRLRDKLQEERIFLAREQDARLLGTWNQVQERIFDRIEETEIPREGRNYTVEVRFQISDRGYVRRPEVVNSSLKQLHQPVLSVLKELRFMPAFERNKPVYSTVTREFDINY